MLSGNGCIFGTPLVLKMWWTFDRDLDMMLERFGAELAGPLVICGVLTRTLFMDEEASGLKVWVVAASALSSSHETHEVIGLLLFPTSTTSFKAFRTLSDDFGFHGTSWPAH